MKYIGLLNNSYQQALLAATVLLFITTSAYSAGAVRTYTLDADFDDGTSINLNHNTPNNNQ